MRACEHRYRYGIKKEITGGPTATSWGTHIPVHPCALSRELRAWYRPRRWQVLRGTDRRAGQRCRPRAHRGWRCRQDCGEVSLENLKRLKTRNLKGSTTLSFHQSKWPGVSNPTSRPHSSFASVLLNCSAASSSRAPALPILFETRLLIHSCQQIIIP